MLLSTKRYENFPCCHRQWRHEGSCSLVHGYSRSFTIIFGATQLDKCGFVMDFGKLRDVKAWLEYVFDHTCLINDDDPELKTFQELHQKGVLSLRTLPNVGMEGTAQFVLEAVHAMVSEATDKRVFVVAVEARENSKNSAWYVQDEFANIAREAMLST